MFKGRVLLIGSILLSLIVPACQNYGFEELPSVIIKEKRHIENVTAAAEVDILFVVDNSGSMAGEQAAIAESFEKFTDVLDEKFGEGKYNIAVITTGVESEGCGPCPADQPTMYSCTNITGESGRFQDLIGHNQGTIQDPDFTFEQDQTCRVMDSDNISSCFYDKLQDRGVILVGTKGCGYERGLSPIRSALSPTLQGSWNANFIRPEAILAVVVISDEEDCGEVGDITENASGYGGRFCDYASKGIGPDGSLADPVGGRPYQLTPVKEYYDFLMGLKDNRKGMVKFAAIVGLTDADNPSATEITYVSNESNASANFACQTPNCVHLCDPQDTGCITACHAYPGTRYVALAEMFGLGEKENGLVDTICQESFDETMEKLATFVSCPRYFELSEEIMDPALANILLNDVAIPRYSCSGSSFESPEECFGTDDMSCSSGQCVETWSYQPPDLVAFPKAPGGIISFALHYDPCQMFTEGEIRIELIYVTP